MTDQQTLTAPEAAETTPRALTVGQALARYDATMRKAATAAGAPTDRSATSGLRLGGLLAHVVFTGTDGKVAMLDMREDAPVLPLNFARARALLTDAYDLADPAVGEHNVVVFADHDTLRRVAKMADGWSRDRGTQDARTLARLLTWRLALPVSMFTPVLTTSLADRYWLPGTGQTDDVSAWDTAFGHGKPYGSRDAFGYLVARALDGIDVDQDVEKSMRNAEKYGARSGQYASDHSACSSFGQAGTVTEAYASVLALDPTLRERNVISGTVAKVRIHQNKADRIEAYLDEVGKLRDGSKVLLFDGFPGGAKVELTLSSVEFVNDTLMAVFKAPSQTKTGAHIIEEAQKNYRPLYAAPAPFLMVRRAPKNRRWTNTPEDRNLPVDIPVDIALAGAPVGD